MPMQVVMEVAVMSLSLAKVGMYSGAVLMGLSGMVLVEAESAGPQAPQAQAPAAPYVPGPYVPGPLGPMVAPSTGWIGMVLGGITAVLSFVAHERAESRRDRREDLEGKVRRVQEEADKEKKLLRDEIERAHREAEMARHTSENLGSRVDDLRTAQKKVPENSEAIAEIRGILQAKGWIAPTTSRKASVLLVDDDPTIRAVMERAIKAEGLVVESAGTVAEALGLLDRLRFGAVVADLNLSGGDGVDVIAEARRLDPKCKVIVITGADDPERLAAARAAGAEDFFAKPFRLEQFFASLAEGVSRA